MDIVRNCFTELLTMTRQENLTLIMADLTLYVANMATKHTVCRKKQAFIQHTILVE